MKKTAKAKIAEIKAQNNDSDHLSFVDEEG
jgi:hypothetical protein